MLFILLFIFFIILSGRITPEIVLVGAVVCALADLLACKVLGWDREKSKRFFRLIPDGLKYLALVFFEIIKANIEVIKIILSPRMEELRPVIFRLDSHLRTDFARTVLADSITITPGTLTVSTDGDDITVHCIGDKFEFFDLELGFNKYLVEIERKERERNG